MGKTQLSLCHGPPVQTTMQRIPQRFTRGIKTAHLAHSALRKDAHRRYKHHLNNHVSSMYLFFNLIHATQVRTQDHSTPEAWADTSSLNWAPSIRQLKLERTPAPLTKHQSTPSLRELHIITSDTWVDYTALNPATINIHTANTPAMSLSIRFQFNSPQYNKNFYFLTNCTLWLSTYTIAFKQFFFFLNNASWII